MSEQDPLSRLGAEVAALDGSPVHTHPDTLEAVHRALVDELEGLAGGAGPGDRPAAG